MSFSSSTLGKPQPRRAIYAPLVAFPEPMLSSSAVRWQASPEWVMQAKWDGVRLLVAVERTGRVRAWSRQGTSLTSRLGDLPQELRAAPAAAVFDGELVSLAVRDGHVIQDFAAVCRAVLNGDGAAAEQLHLVAFDVLELDGEDLRARPWSDRDALLRTALPTSDRVRVIQTRPATPEGHEAIVGLGFEGTVLKRARSSYRPGRQSAWQKVKARHCAIATLRALTPSRDGKTYAVCDLDGRRVTALSSPRFACRIGGRVGLVYSRVDADGTLREVRTQLPFAAGAHG